MQFCSQPRYENEVIHTSSTTGNIAVLLSLRCIFMRKTMDSFKKMVRIYWKNICVNHTYD